MFYQQIAEDVFMNMIFKCIDILYTYLFTYNVTYTLYKQIIAALVSQFTELLIEILLLNVVLILSTFN